MRLTIKIIFIGYITCLTLAASLFAEGYYIEQTITLLSTTGEKLKTSQLKMWVDGSNLRFEEDQTVIIFDQKTGKAVSLDRSTKTYFEMDVKEEDLNTALDEEIKDLKNAYQKTGQSKQIGQWNCYEVRFKSSTGGEEIESTNWYTEDLGVNWYDVLVFGQDSMVQRIKKASGKAKTLLEALPKGLLVQKNATIKKEGKVQREETRLTKFEKTTVPPERFKVPPDYRKADDPRSRP